MCEVVEKCLTFWPVDNSWFTNSIISGLVWIPTVEIPDVWHWTGSTFI